MGLISHFPFNFQVEQVCSEGWFRRDRAPGALESVGGGRNTLCQLGRVGSHAVVVLVLSPGPCRGSVEQLACSPWGISQMCRHSQLTGAAVSCSVCCSGFWYKCWPLGADTTVVPLQNWRIGLHHFFGSAAFPSSSVTNCAQTDHEIDLVCRQATLLSNMSASRKRGRP